MAVSAPFIVRPLRPSDAGPVLDLARSLSQWFDSEGLARIARDLASHGGFVAVRGDRLVGFVTWTPLDAEVAELSWMGVAEDLQHQGIGTTLLAALVASLRSPGFRFLEVSTVADNVDYEPYVETRRFYRARGFVDFRVDARYWGSGDDRYDRLLLRRDLGPGPGGGPPDVRTIGDAAVHNGSEPRGDSQAVFKSA